MTYGEMGEQLSWEGERREVVDLAGWSICSVSEEDVHGIIVSARRKMWRPSDVERVVKGLRPGVGEQFVVIGRNQFEGLPYLRLFTQIAWCRWQKLEHEGALVAGDLALLRKMPTPGELQEFLEKDFGDPLGQTPNEEIPYIAISGNEQPGRIRVGMMYPEGGMRSQVRCEFPFDM